MIDRIFCGPMSKNIVDAIIEFCIETGNRMVMIATRRQVEWNGGYVNNWTTNEFNEYVKSRTDLITLQRDHAGPGQGITDDDGYESLRHDARFFNRIHLDPWKKYPLFNEGLQYTTDMIKFCHALNPQLKFEIGTEEAIRCFDAEELDELLTGLLNNLGTLLFSKIDYAVIQSGTSLKGTLQTGNYNSNRLSEMAKVCRKFGVLSKEHNGDYMPAELIKEKFAAGLDSINIAPEFGLTETIAYLDNIRNQELLEKFWKICYNSGRWVKWVDKDFNPFENKRELIKICGHYVFSDTEFLSTVKVNLPWIDQEIKNRIRQKLENFI
jgi:hypothetical protein